MCVLIKISVDIFRYMQLFKCKDDIEKLTLQLSQASIVLKQETEM